MRLRTLLAGSVLTLSLAPSARAQSVIEMIGSDIFNAAGDAVALWASPFHASANDWLLAGAALGATAGISVVDDDVDRWMIRHEDDGIFNALDPVREGGSAFTGKTVTPIAGGLYVIALVTKNRDIRDGIFGCLSSYAATSVVRNQLLYRVIARTRPDSSRFHEVAIPPAEQGDQYDIDIGSSSWGRHSFPAGHVANIAACASFLNHRFSMGVVEPLLYVVTAGVGIGRQVDRRHWTSDTVIGIIFGYAAGKFVAERSQHRLADLRTASSLGSTLRDAFYVTPSSGGMLVGWRAVF